MTTAFEAIAQAANLVNLSLSGMSPLEKREIGEKRGREAKEEQSRIGPCVSHSSCLLCAGNMLSVEDCTALLQLLRHSLNLLQQHDALLDRAQLAARQTHLLAQVARELDGRKVV